MIIQSRVLSCGKESLKPRRYVPNKSVFPTFAHYYQRDPDVLYSDVKQTVDEPEEELSSEEEEDNQIRTTDRIALSLVSDDNDTRVDTYVLDKDTDAFYVHHDTFLHGTPTSISVIDSDDPYFFVSSTDGLISAYNIFTTNHFLPDMVIKCTNKVILNLETYNNNILANDGESLTAWSTDGKLLWEKKVTNSTMAVTNNTNNTTSTSPIILNTPTGISLYDPRDSTLINLPPLTISQSSVVSLSISNSTYCIGTTDGTVLHMNTTGTTFTKDTIHKSKINNLVTEDRYIISASTDETVTIFDMINREIISKKDTHLDSVTVSVPHDDPMIYVYPQEDGELGINRWEVSD